MVHDQRVHGLQLDVLGWRWLLNRPNLLLALTSDLLPLLGKRRNGLGLLWNEVLDLVDVLALLLVALLELFVLQNVVQVLVEHNLFFEGQVSD